MVRSLPVRGWKEPPGQNMSGPAAVASLTAWHVLSRIVIYCHKIITHQHSHFVPLHRIFRARGFILSRLRATATRHQPSRPQRLISHRDGPHVIPVSPWHHLLTLTTEYEASPGPIIKKPGYQALYYVWTFNNTLTKRLMAAINRRQSCIVRVIIPECALHIMYTSQIMAAIMRRDQFMQMFGFQISRMLDRTQIQIMKIFYSGDLANAQSRAKTLETAVMLKWWAEGAFYSMSNCWDKK